MKQNTFGCRHTQIDNMYNIVHTYTMFPFLININFFVVVHNHTTYDWKRCKILNCVSLAESHISILYVHMGLIVALYRSSLFSNNSGALCPINQYILLDFSPSCFLLALMCACKPSIQVHFYVFFTLFVCGY